MRYEIYIDKVFVVCTVIHFYSLLLVQQSVGNRISRGRLVFSSIVGGVDGTLFFIGGMKGFFVRALIGILGGIFSIGIAFWTKNKRAFVKIMRQCLQWIFIYGGAIAICQKVYYFIWGDYIKSYGILVMAVIWYKIFSTGIVNKKKTNYSLCQAVLYKAEKYETVEALIDSGNSLYEPISGKPVCVLDYRIGQKIWNEKDLYRVIPYQSIGKRRGILKGYLLPRMCIEIDGIERQVDNVYVALSREELGKNPKLIIHQRIFEDTKVNV